MCSQILRHRFRKDRKSGSSGSSSRVVMSLSSSIENESRALTDTTSSNVNTTRDTGEDVDLHAQMWLATAGVLAYVPRVGESVFYFPQGHVEQVEPYVDQDSEMVMPIYPLSSKILCKVLDVKLRVEIQDDEVFAQITLLPISEQDDAASDLEYVSSARATRTKPMLYSKVLTSSDTGPQREFSLPKRIAEECLPLLDMTQLRPMGEVVMTDLHGSVWRFRHVYRGQPKRHLLTTGWSAFIASKKLVVGDTCFFLRGANGELQIGVRHSAKLQTNLSPSVISRNTMQHGILASAFHHVRVGSMFAVYYRPWTCRSPFILPFHRYLESEKKDYSPGKRFKMLFEDDADGEQRFGGTVMGIEDIDPVRWPGSKWKSIKVRWDSIPDEHSLPERISPWDIELVLPTKHKQSFPQTPPKRICTNSSREQNPVIADAGVYAQPYPVEGVFQGQEARQNLWHVLVAEDPQTSSPKPTSQESTARPDETDPGINDLLVLRIGQMKLECPDGEAPDAEDNDGPPSRQKEIKFFGFKLLEASEELSSQQDAGHGE